MSSEETQPVVETNELLARFITSSRWFRSSDSTIRSEAFIPYPYPELSVTRHRLLSEEELWKVGQAITDGRITDDRKITLHGRADISAENVRKQKMTVEPRPVPENLNHADILGWPPDKPAQKMLALELAAAASLVMKPN